MFALTPLLPRSHRVSSQLLVVGPPCFSLCPLFHICASGPLASSAALGLSRRMEAAALRTARDSLAERSRELSHSLRLLKQTEKRSECCFGDGREATAEERRAALLLFVLNDHDAAAALAYLQGGPRNRKPPLVTGGDICDWYVQCPMDALLDIVSETEPAEVSSRARAVKFLVEWKLRNWVQGVNSVQRVAPRNEEIQQKTQDIESDVLEKMDDAMAPPMVVRQPSHQWIRRWRSRWGGRRGRLHIRDELSRDALLGKDAQLRTPPTQPQTGD